MEEEILNNKSSIKLVLLKPWKTYNFGQCTTKTKFIISEKFNFDILVFITKRRQCVKIIIPSLISLA